MTTDSEAEQLEPIDVLIDEYLDELRIGRPRSIDQYCDTHPELAEKIREIFPSVALFENVAGSDTRVSAHSSADTVEENPTGGSAHDEGWSLPHVLGRYTLTRELGQGNMGRVYLAEDTVLGRTMALKIPALTQPNSVDSARFRREAQAMAAVTHPNLCPIYDVGQIEDTNYLTMEYVQGRSLDKVLSDTGPLEFSHAVELVHQVDLIEPDYVGEMMPRATAGKCRIWLNNTVK